MNSIQLIASVIVGSGLLMFSLAIPLILRRVPPNCVYGVRTNASFASNSDWYRINAIGGRYLVATGLVILITGGVGFCLPVSMFVSYSVTATATTLLAVVLSSVRLVC
jgi:uncharacterized membrane protein